MSYTGRKGRRGGSALEAALFLPWYIFLFVGAYDWGFFAHALISTENAARVGALYASSAGAPGNASDSTGVCEYARRELASEVNKGAFVCPAAALPVIITADLVTGADGEPATRVAVTYQTHKMIPIPGLLKGQYTFRRVVEMKL